MPSLDYGKDRVHFEESLKTDSKSMTLADRLKSEKAFYGM